MGTVQAWVGERLRDRVAGADAPERAAQIWGATGERWFTPDDPIWRVHADAAMFPGGIASLLLQMQHPLAMAGVAGHSGYRGDPWGRLQRTSHYLAATTYGTVEHAEAAIMRVRRIHDRVTGIDEEGRAYAANDPNLLMWVHVAEIWSFLRAYRLFGSGRLTPAEQDTYVAQAGTVAERLGVASPPDTVDALEAVLDGYRGELEITAAARAASRFLLLNPPLPLPARPGYGLIAAGGVRVLPTWAQRGLGIYLAPGVSTLTLQPLGMVATATIRWAMAGVERGVDSYRDEATAGAAGTGS